MSDVIHIALTPIKYIGKRAKNTDATYGTNLTWQAGETLLVPAESANRMLAHKDVYEHGEASADHQVMAVTVKAESEDEKTQEVRDSIASWEKPALASYALNNFNVKVDKRQPIDALRAQVTQLVDQFGTE